jgi:hypothetical protein
MSTAIVTEMIPPPGFILHWPLAFRAERLRAAIGLILVLIALADHGTCSGDSGYWPSVARIRLS